MKYLVGIGCVNRFDLLQKAINSINLYWAYTRVIDNSEHRQLRGHSIGENVRIIEPPVPFSYSQTLNLLRKEAIRDQYDVMIYMHNDTEANPGTAELFLSHLQSFVSSGNPWGVAFTTCYSMAAYSVEALKVVGEWDYTYLPGYFSDTDMYRRLALAGYGWLKTELPVTHHDGGGNTYKSDPLRATIQQITTPLYLRYYHTKWGGYPGQEQYVTPFNY